MKISNVTVHLLCGFVLILTTANASPSDKGFGKIGTLDAILEEHIRALDAGEDTASIRLPNTFRQTGTTECVSESRCSTTVDCGGFECSHCDKLRCQPFREVRRTRELFNITCERSPCGEDPKDKSRNCCTRAFCITRTCKPALLPMIDLAGKSVHDTLTVETIIKVPKKISADIYLLSDTTGSMGGEIAAVRSGMNAIIQNLTETQSADIAFGVGEFKDETELVDGFKNLQPLDKNKDKSFAAVKKLVAQGGGDGPEGGLLALYKVAKDPAIGWRRNSRRIVVFYGDAPQHEPTCVSGTVLKRQNVIDTLLERNISVVSVSFQGGLDRSTFEISCEKSTNRTNTVRGDQGKDIANKTFGAHAFVSARSPSSEEVIEKITSAIAESKLFLDLAFSTCGEAVSIEYSPSFPIMVTLGEEVKFNQKITIRPEICDFGISECKTSFSVSGPLVAEQEISTIDVRGCGP